MTNRSILAATTFHLQRDLYCTGQGTLQKTPSGKLSQTTCAQVDRLARRHCAKGAPQEARNALSVERLRIQLPNTLSPVRIPSPFSKKILLPSAVHLEERLTVSHSVPAPGQQSVRQKHTVWVFCQWQMRPQAVGRPCA